jgi:hypothetical protein
MNSSCFSKGTSVHNQQFLRPLQEIIAESELPKFLLSRKILSLKTRGSHWIYVTEDKYRENPRKQRLMADTLTLFWDVQGTVQLHPNRHTE